MATEEMATGMSHNAAASQGVGGSCGQCCADASNRRARSWVPEMKRAAKVVLPLTRVHSCPPVVAAACHGRRGAAGLTHCACEPQRRWDVWHRQACATGGPARAPAGWQAAQAASGGARRQFGGLGSLGTSLLLAIGPWFAMMGDGGRQGSDAQGGAMSRGRVEGVEGRDDLSAPLRPHASLSLPSWPPRPLRALPPAPNPAR